MAETVEDPLAGVDWELPGRKPRTRPRGSWHFVRSMKVPEDVWMLDAPVPAVRQTLTKIRHTHHQLARLIATGVSEAEASLITGYQPAYISVLKGDPSFQELLCYYATQREQIFVDVVERMRSLGLATLDEIQARLDQEPEEWTKRELMELAELMLVKPAAATSRAMSTQVAPVSVNVKFVTATHGGPVIDMEPSQ